MSTQFNPHEVEKKVHDYWKKNFVVEKITDFSSNAKTMQKFYLLDGPPYVNDKPHVGHVKTTVFKDVWGKFKYMQGHAVWWQPGFDCGGLPIENKVEKKLGVKSKDDIEKMGVDKFIQECAAFARGNEPAWLDSYKKIGAWRGWLTPYLTSENYYIESGWWAVKQIYDKGLIVEGERPGFWCPKCETVLSGYEASDSYENKEDPAIFIKFQIKGKKDEYLIVWTTTPWTLPANVAVAVHPDETYVRIEAGTEKYILAEKRLDMLTELGIGYKILKRMKGAELDGIKYEPLLDVPMQKTLKKMDNALKVVLSVPLIKVRVASKMQTKRTTSAEESVEHIVDMETGSGMVHIAPGHGEVDNRLGKHYNLPELSPVDDKGKLTKDAGQFSGLFVKDADSLIIDYLRKKGLLLQAGKITHSYPLCWRCKSPLIYRMSKQWFLKIEPIKNKLLKANEKVNWLPAFAKERMHNHLEDSPDWAVTRQRYWGIPLPIWVCKQCGQRRVISSFNELKKYANRELPESMDLHKHMVDKVQLRCDCGKEMNRIPDIMSVWFDSGIAPWASLGYPYKNKTLFEKLKPVDLIDESQDQIRGWFYSLLVCSIATMDESPYKTVCLNGWTLDDKGEKMSKSLGNVVSAEDAYATLGADTLRLYTCSDNPPWETQKFSIERAKENGRMLNILWNTYIYFKTYCNVNEAAAKEKKIEDIWLESRLNTLIESVTKHLDNFEFHEASRKLMDFIIDDISHIYIKIIRSREDDAVYYEMTKVFRTLMPMFSVFCPFVTEYIYNDLFNESVHLAGWPTAQDKLIRADLETDMTTVSSLVAACNAFRQEKAIKLRWPLKSVVTDAKIENEEMTELIRILANIKDVIFVKSAPENATKFEHGSFILSEEVDKEEALLRELLRAVQAERKRLSLNVTDAIALVLDTTNAYVKKNDKRIAEHVGAFELLFKSIEDKNALGVVDVEGEKIKFSLKKI